MSKVLNKYGRKDLRGVRSGRLVAIQYSHTKNKKAYWLCRCDCGAEKVVVGTSLTNKHIKSCGCLRKDILVKRSTKHGGANTRLYRIWQDMRRRCYDKKRPQYKDWGGRGIIVCKEWLEFNSFMKWAIASGYKDNLTIERVNNDGNYCPSNCKFIPKSKQSINRRNSVFITFNGKIMTIAQWARHLGFKRGTLDSRIKRGWPIAKALIPTQPESKKEKRENGK